VTRRARPGLALDKPLYAIAGVQVDNRYNFALGERITIRGFGARTQFGVRGVRVLVDGIPATLPDGQTTLNHVDPASIESVEVIRTPLAALYGNAAGGVVDIRTAAIPAAQLEHSARFVNGSHGLNRQQIAFGGTDTHGGYLLSVARLDYRGFRTHNSANNRYVSGQSTLTSGNAAIRATAHHVRYDALNPGALPDSMLARSRHLAFPTNESQRTGERGKHSQVGVTLDRALGLHRLALSTYGISRTLHNPIPPRIIDLSRRAGGARVSLGSSATTRVAWESGVETALQRDDRLNFQNVGGARGAVTLDQNERVRAVAWFATARTAVTRIATVQAGLRRDAVEFRATDHLVDAGNPDDSGERKLRAWSPSVGVSFAIGAGAKLFANSGISFETPTTTELANRPTGAGGFNPELEPQRTLSHELGINGTNGAFRYQLVWYRARVSDGLVPFEVPDSPGRQFFRNAASAIHRGAELMLAGSFFRTVSARLAYSYIDARYRQYSVGAVSFNGNRLPGVAPHRLESLLRFGGDEKFLDIEGRYQARLPVDDANAAHSPGFVLADGRAQVGELNWKRLRALPFAGVENVFGRTYNASVVVNAAGARYYEPGPGRTFFIGFDAGFEIAASRDEL
jgi:iron complex outermembrane receptor protein